MRYPKIFNPMVCKTNNITIDNTIAIFIFLFAFSFTGAVAMDRIERMEPPSWWTGMKNPILQLMVHGENISGLNPAIDYPGVTIENISKTENPNYLFIDINISPSTAAGIFQIRFSEGKKVVLTQNYTLAERKPDSSQRQGFNTSDVIYLIMPDRFANGNPDNDNDPALKEKCNRNNPDGRHGGDIQGVINHLDYISEMGFTAIWLTPVIENDQPVYSYHGYSATDFYRIDPRFGTNEDYKKLVSLAKGKGIKIIKDMVFNHCGAEHWWMKDMPAADWINYNGNFTRTNHERTTIQDPYASEYDFHEFSDGWFDTHMPDLNEENRLLATYMIQNTIWWIEYSGISGIRVDTYSYPDPGFMSDWSCRIMNEYPEFNIVGEEWSLNPAIIAFWQDQKINPNGYTSCLPSLMDFPLQDAVIDALLEKETWNSGMKSLYRMLANDFLYADPSNLVIFPDNHDMSRVFTQLGEDPQLYKLAIAFFLTGRGIPQFFYGTEIQMSNPGTTAHGIIRSDFPGGWKGDPQYAFNHTGLTDAQVEAKNYVKRILNWRKESEVIHNGKFLHFIPENQIYVYFRYNDTDMVMVMIGNNDSPQEIKMERFSEILTGKSTGLDILSNTKIDLSGSIKIGPKEAKIIEIQ